MKSAVLKRGGLKNCYHLYNEIQTFKFVNFLRNVISEQQLGKVIHYKTLNNENRTK